jgi:hypothetical protein
MTVKELIQQTNWKVLSDGPDETISSAYICDLLSWVMAHAQSGTAWVTVQAHLNVVAVAALTGCACVIIPENIAVSEETLYAARDKDVTIISAPCSSYGAALVLSKLGIGEVTP